MSQKIIMKLQDFKKNLQNSKKNQSVFAGILLGTGLSIYALVPTTSHVIQGDAGSGFGSSVSQGDMNGDGIIDMLVGSPNTDSYSVVLMNSDGSEKSRVSKTYNEVMNPSPAPAAPVPETPTPTPALNSNTGVPAVPVTDPEVSPAPVSTPTETPAPVENSNSNTNTEETAPSAPAQTPETPPSSPTGFFESLFGITKASAQTPPRSFGQFVLTIPDLDTDGTPDLLISDNTSSYIIFQNADFSVKSFITLSKRITHAVKNTDSSYLFRTDNGDIVYATLSPLGITEISTLTTGTLSLTGGYDIDIDGTNDIVLGTSDNDIRIKLLNPDYTVKNSYTLNATSEKSYGESIPDYGKIISLVPDTNADGIPDLALGFPNYNNGKGLVLVSSLTKLNDAIVFNKTWAAIPDEIQNSYGLAITASPIQTAGKLLTLNISAQDKILNQEITRLPGFKKANTIQSLSDDFVITVKTDNAGTSGSTQFTIPTAGAGYSYNIDTNNDGVNDLIAQTGSTTITFGSAGTKTIRINGTFPQIQFANGGDKLKILNINQWGTNPWTSMINAFYGCANMDVTAVDVPNLTGVTSFSAMFAGTTSLVGTSAFNSWNTSTITNMNSMFYLATTFNQNIGSWNTSAVTNMGYMFYNAVSFNQNIGSWNTSAVTNMGYMFFTTSLFNNGGSSTINNWNTGSVTNMEYMFEGSSVFNQNIGSWNTANVTNMQRMFTNASAFNQNIGSWNTSAVTNMFLLFYGATSFNQNIGSWNTGSIANMSNMFYGATSFNNGGSNTINNWNTAAVTTMYGMFNGASVFNQNIGSWNTAAVTNMTYMLAGNSLFNQNIGSWNTSAVTTMLGMFQNSTAFNQNIGSWNTSLVTSMNSMFYGATSFNNGGLSINGWNTSGVTNMTNMFRNATVFNQSISAWDINQVTAMTAMFTGATAYSSTNYDLLLSGWAAQTPMVSGLTFNMNSTTTYCGSSSSRSVLTSAPNNWTITDGGRCPSTITSVTSSTSNGSYKAGNTISVQVVFDQTVNVTGTPQLTLETGVTDQVVNYTSGTGTNTLTFNYTVQTGDTTSDLDYLSTGALALNGGTILGTTGVGATLTLATPGAANSLGANKAIVIDTTAPAVVVITTPTASQNIQSPFTFTGTCETGATVSIAHAGITGSPITTTCSGSAYSVSVPFTSDGIKTNISVTQTDLAGNISTATTRTVTTDNTVPTAPGIPDMTTATDIGIGTNSDNNTTDLTPDFQMSCETGSTVEIFRGGTISLGTGTCSGSSVIITSAAMPAGTYSITAKQTDLAGNLSIVSSGLSITITASTTPTVASISSLTTNGSYKAGGVISIQILFDQAVVVTGTPTLTLETGVTDRTINYTSGSGTNTLIFTYTVQAGDTTSDLDYTSTSALALNSGTILSSLGVNPATLTLPAPGVANSLGANKAIVIDTTAPAQTGAPVLSGDTSPTMNTIPTFTLSCETGATVTLRDDTTVIGTGLCALGTVTITASTLAAGTHSLINAFQTDIAGNVSTSSLNLTVIIITPPTGGSGGGSSRRRITPPIENKVETKAKNENDKIGSASSGGGTFPITVYDPKVKNNILKSISLKKKVTETSKLSQTKESIQNKFKSYPESIQKEFCSNLPTKTLKRGVYKDEQVTNLERLYAYVFGFALNIDADYGKNIQKITYEIESKLLNMKDAGLIWNKTTAKKISEMFNCETVLKTKKEKKLTNKKTLFKKVLFLFLFLFFFCFKHRLTIEHFAEFFCGCFVPDKICIFHIEKF